MIIFIFSLSVFLINRNIISKLFNEIHENEDCILCLGFFFSFSDIKLIDIDAFIIFIEIR